MKVCVTEKPSVARDIARLLGANDRHEGYFEGNGYQVTWTFGHLCCLKEPNDYTDLWKRWSLASLPMIPQRFGIKLIEDEGIKKQFKVIETLIANAEEVINCGDAGQEGELIQRWVYQKARCNKPVKRLWISSLTDESIREGFQQLQEASNFDNLYFAGLSRAIGDWILGMNATRLYTLKYRDWGSRNVLSIGRVQTPTLALIVTRQREIENFVPEDYWEIKTKYRETIFNSTKGKFKVESEASVIVEKIKEFPLTVTSVAKKKGKEAPPRLFDLTSLQVECNKKFGYSADETLRLIQSLYEKKVTTYPRVDTTFLSDDIYPKIPGIMEAMKPYSSLTQPVLAGKLPKSKKVFDNSKVTDHHAIIPTNVDPASVFLSREEKLVYDLVAKRFIAAFYPDCEFSTTTVMAQVSDYEFKATGKEILKDGWRVIYNKEKSQNVDEKEKEDDDNGIMPTFVEGESGPHEPSLLKKTTQPPKYYTEGTLLRAMETAGKFVDDDELRDAMKENGIGRPSTRAAIIETLHKRHYIAKQRKSLVATTAGIQLIDTIKEELLKSAKLTGLWENKLRKIERGEFSAQQFIDELKVLVNEIVLNVLRDNSSTTIAVQEDEKKKGKKSSSENKEKKPRKPRLKSIEEISCPVCGKGHIIKGRTAYGCSEFRTGCEMRLPFDSYPSDLTPAKLNTMIKKAFKQNKT
ncbi:MAG: DNA topoisomerase 3 [Muribaculaceae bacterium]|nr:DNA topoisomerase 3 [Muribaculaceae bacterium]